MKIPERSWICSGTTVSMRSMRLLTAWPPATHIKHHHVSLSDFGERAKDCKGARWADVFEIEGRGHTILKHHSHRRALVQNPQLPLRTLLIRRVRKDPPIQQCPVSVRNHTPNIPRTVRFSPLLNWKFQAIKVLLDRLFPVQRVPLVDAVDCPGFGESHVRVREDELAQGVVHGEAVDGATFHSDDELGAGAVHGEAAGDELATGHQQLRLVPLAVFLELEYTEDGPHAHSGIEIAAPVDWIAHHSVPRLGVLVKYQTFFFLFRDQEAALPGRAHGGDEEVVADDVEFFLVVAGGV